MPQNCNLKERGATHRRPKQQRVDQLLSRHVLPSQRTSTALARSSADAAIFRIAVTAYIQHTAAPPGRHTYLSTSTTRACPHHIHIPPSSHRPHPCRGPTFPTQRRPAPHLMHAPILLIPPSHVRQHRRPQLDAARRGLLLAAVPAHAALVH